MAQLCVYLPNNSYSEYWNMPRIDRQEIIGVWNKKLEAEKKANRKT